MAFQKGHGYGNFGNGFKKGVDHGTKGVPRSAEVKAKISSANKGKVRTKPVWNKGLKGYLAGELHYNWKGGGSKIERARFRDQMQKLIFKRDNFTCQKCKQYGVYLRVDHIKSWADYPELRFKESNCRTLCMACHYYITFNKKLPKGVIWGHNFSRRIAS